MLAWVTGQIDESLLQKLEFVLEENRVYRALLDRDSPQWRLQDTERKALAEVPSGIIVGRFEAARRPPKEPCGLFHAPNPRPQRGQTLDGARLGASSA